MRERIWSLMLKSGLSVEEIKSFLADIDAQYTTHTIKKANGAPRVIAVPSEPLTNMQRTVLKIVQEPRVSRRCKGYERGTSIRKNAEAHRKANHILHVDIQAFFPSVGKELFEKTYGGKFSKQDLSLLWSVVSYRGGLPIGAATSPFIANRIMREADRKLNRISPFIRYTRYADDLVFSSKKPIDKKIVFKIERILAETTGLRLNPKKTYFMSYRKEVTGIIITDEGKLSVGTSYKKHLKQDLYNLLVKQEGYIDIVRGRFAHLQHIEPAYAARIRVKYLPYDKIGFFKSKEIIRK